MRALTEVYGAFVKKGASPGFPGGGLRRLRSAEDFILALLLPAGIILGWYFASSTGVLHQSVLPSPGKFLETYAELLFGGSLGKHVATSMLRVCQGFFVGAVLGIIIGALRGIFPRANKLFSLFFGVLMPIPMVGWVPLLILWCGIGETTKIAVIALGTFWSVLLNTHDGIKNVDKRLLEVAEILEKGKIHILLRVVIPAARPAIITGIRLGFGNAWKSVVSAEMLAASRGVGFLITYARELSQPDVMIVGLLSIGIIGVLIDRVMVLFQKWTLRWNTGAS
jgi:sulfonate transport system permease protein